MRTTSTCVVTFLCVLFILTSINGEEQKVISTGKLIIQSAFNPDDKTTVKPAIINKTTGWWPDGNHKLTVDKLKSRVNITDGILGLPAKNQKTCLLKVLKGPLAINAVTGNVDIRRITPLLNIPGVGNYKITECSLLSKPYSNSDIYNGMFLKGNSEDIKYNVGKLFFDRLYVFRTESSPFYKLSFSKQSKLTSLNSATFFFIDDQGRKNYVCKSTDGEEFDISLDKITLNCVESNVFQLKTPKITFNGLVLNDGKYPSFRSATLGDTSHTLIDFAFLGEGQLQKDKIVFLRNNKIDLGFASLNLGDDKGKGDIYFNQDGLFANEGSATLKIFTIHVVDFHRKNDGTTKISGGGAEVKDLKGISAKGVITKFNIRNKNNWAVGLDLEFERENILAFSAGGEIVRENGKLKKIMLKGGGQSKKEKKPHKLRIKKIELCYEEDKAEIARKATNWTFDCDALIGFGKFPNLGANLTICNNGLKKMFIQAGWEKPGFELYKEALFLKKIKGGIERKKVKDPFQIKANVKFLVGKKYDFPLFDIDTRLATIYGNTVINVGDLFYMKSDADAWLFDKFLLAKATLAVGEIPNEQGEHHLTGAFIGGYVNLADIIYGDAEIWAYKKVNNKDYYVGMKIDAGVRIPRNWKFVGGKKVAGVKTVLSNKNIEFGFKILFTRWKVVIHDKGWSIKEPNQKLNLAKRDSMSKGSSVILANYRMLHEKRQQTVTKSNNIPQRFAEPDFSTKKYKSSKVIEYEIKKTDKIPVLMVNLDFSDYAGDAYMTVQFPNGKLYTPQNTPELTLTATPPKYKLGQTPVCYQHRYLEAGGNDPAVKECEYIFGGPKRKNIPLNGTGGVDDLANSSFDNFSNVKAGIYKITIYGTEDVPPATDSAHFNIMAQNNNPTLKNITLKDIGKHKFRVEWDIEDADRDDVIVKLMLGDNFKSPEDDLIIGKHDGYSLNAGETSAEFDLNQLNRGLANSQYRYLFLSYRDDFENTDKYVFVKKLEIPRNEKVPPKVTGVSFCSNSDGSVDLKWDKLKWDTPAGLGVTSYSVICQPVSPEDAQHPVVKSTIDAETTNLRIDDGLLSSRDYLVRVCAIAQEDFYDENNELTNSEIYRGIPSDPVKIRCYDITANDPPQFLNPPKKVAKVDDDYESVIRVIDSKGDYTILELVGENIPKGLMLTPYMNQWKLTMHPTIDQVGYYPLTLRAKDNRGAITDLNFTLAIINIAENVISPTINGIIPQTVYIGETFNYKLDVSDYPDDAELVFKKIIGPAGLRILPQGVINWTPAESDQGTQPLTVRINVVDHKSKKVIGSLYETYSFFVKPNPWLDFPSLPSVPVPQNWQQNVDLTTTFSWKACRNTTYYELYLWNAQEACPGEPSAVNLTTNSWHPTSILGPGTYCWQVVAGNGEKRRFGPIWSFSTDTPPAANNDIALTRQNTPVDINVLNNDIDLEGARLSISTITGSKHATVMTTADKTTIRYTPNPDFYGLDKFFYTVSDETGGTDTAFVIVAVNKQGNASPIVSGTYIETSKNTAVFIDPLQNAHDPEGRILSVISSTQPENGTVKLSISGMPVEYIPHHNFSGIDTFNVIIADMDGGVSESKVTVKVSNETTIKPVLKPDYEIVLKDKTSQLNVMVNDAFPGRNNNMRIVSFTPPASGTVSISKDSQSLFYTPNPGFIGKDSFAYTVAAGKKGNATTTVTVSVIPEADYIASGSVINIRAGEVSDSEFLRKTPRIFADYVNIPNNRKQRLFLKNIEKASKQSPIESISAQWAKPVKLYHSAEYHNIQLGPYLLSRPMNEQKIDKLFAYINKKEGKKQIERLLFYSPPIITRAEGLFLKKGDKLTISGSFFGSKAPKILLECEKNGKWIYRTCPIDKATKLKFHNATGKANSSCMKILTDDEKEEVGFSQITVTFPTLPNGCTPTGYIILNNQAGLAAFRLDVLHPVHDKKLNRNRVKSK